MLWKLCHPPSLASFLLLITLASIHPPPPPFFLLITFAPALSFPASPCPDLPRSHHLPATLSSSPLQRLVVLVNNWFWLSQCADKDNSRAIKSSSPVLSSCFFFPSLPSLLTHVHTHTHTHTHTNTHTVSCLSVHSPPSSSPPPRRLSFCSAEVDFPLSVCSSFPLFPSFIFIPPLLTLFPFHHILCCLHSFQSHPSQDAWHHVHCAASRADDTVGCAAAQLNCCDTVVRRAWQHAHVVVIRTVPPVV